MPCRRQSAAQNSWNSIARTDVGAWKGFADHCLPKVVGVLYSRRNDGYLDLLRLKRVQHFIGCGPWSMVVRPLGFSPMWLALRTPKPPLGNGQGAPRRRQRRDVCGHGLDIGLGG